MIIACLYVVSHVPLQLSSGLLMVCSVMASLVALFVTFTGMSSQALSLFGSMSYRGRVTGVLVAGSATRRRSRSTETSIIQGMSLHPATEVSKLFFVSRQEARDGHRLSSRVGWTERIVVPKSSLYLFT